MGQIFFAETEGARRTGRPQVKTRSLRHNGGGRHEVEATSPVTTVHPVVPLPETR